MFDVIGDAAAQQVPRAAGLARVYPVAAISMGSNGEQLSEYGDQKEAGAVAVSDDGRPVLNSMLMRRALEYARTFNLPVISHAEDLELRGELADSTGGWTGADLELVCKKAAILALEEHRMHPSESFRVTARHLTDARAQVKTMK